MSATPTQVTEILAALLSDHDRGGLPLPAGLVALCARSLAVGGVGMALMTDAGPAGTLAASDARARTLEDLQFSLGEGPCVDASQGGRPVLQPDLAQTGGRRWPVFAAAAADAGLAAVFAFPLRVGGIRLGVLDLYRTTAGVLAADELGLALSFADAATAVLLHLQARAAGRGPPLGSLAVLDDHAEVHQATGVVSVQAGVPLQEALLLLRARAYAEQRPIDALARDVLSGVVDFDDDVEGG
ncbi:GAF and ANTAR domain-containing protein [Modestobacter sp. NPDC049651]|uniref:GAF and ANTAR domain-containing protein n=1 Tax=unclassified Modestobacter TaxID=2643866 RepID=UPI00340EEB31